MLAELLIKLFMAPEVLSFSAQIISFIDYINATGFVFVFDVVWSRTHILSLSVRTDSHDWRLQIISIKPRVSQFTALFARLFKCIFIFHTYNLPVTHRAYVPRRGKKR